MKKNMGTSDKVVRIIIAVIFASLYFTGKVTGTAGIVLLVFAGILVITSYISFCPLYLPFKMSTRKDQK